MTAISFGCRATSARAAADGRKSSSWMACITRDRFSSETYAAPLRTRDTVGTETPARRATSLITGGFGALFGIALSIARCPARSFDCPAGDARDDAALHHREGDQQRQAH